MQTDQIMLAVCGLCIIALGIGNLLGSASRFVIYTNIVQELDIETRKKYQKAIFPPYVLIGLLVVVLAIILPRLQDTSAAYIAAGILIPLFVGSVIWVFICNKKYLGRFVAPKTKRFFK